MKEFIKQRLQEGLNGISIPQLRIPKEISLTPEDMKLIKEVNWQDLKVVDSSSDGNIFHFNIQVPGVSDDINDNIIVDIQVVMDVLYQMHINIPTAIQRLGLGYKAYLAMINNLGQLYSGKGRRHNSNVNKIWARLKNEPGLDCYSSPNGDLCFAPSTSDEDKEMVLSVFKPSNQ